jgi:hypothetical protein
MITKYYLIRNINNNHYYTEDHGQPEADRWSSNITDAYKYTSYADAETEINIDTSPYTEFTIQEILIKS